MTWKQDPAYQRAYYATNLDAKRAYQRRRYAEKKKAELAEWRREWPYTLSHNMGRGLLAEAVKMAAELALAAWDTAVRDGHDMEPLANDTELGTFVAMCWGCQGYLAVDIMEEDHAYGQVVARTCVHVPEKTAVRRDEMSLDAAATSASDLMADFHPPWLEPTVSANP